jgi:hypothetical protein
MLLSSILDRREVSETVADPIARDPIEQQILAAGILSEAQVEAIRGFQRRKGLTFGQAAITLGLVQRESLFLALSKHYNYPVLSCGSAHARISSELVAGPYECVVIFDRRGRLGRPRMNAAFGGTCEQAIRDQRSERRIAATH